MPTVRPMTEADEEAVVAVQDAAFLDLSRRFGFPHEAMTDTGPAVARVARCRTTTPGGAWVSEDGGRITGASLGIVREGLWGLSLLVVHPDAQSAGTGRALLAGALEASAGTHGGLILASEDHRALRAYQRAGFDLRPCFDARGPVKSPPVRPQTVREGRWPADREHCDAASRAVRGAAHGDDLGVAIAAGARLLVHEEGGFALLRRNEVYLLAAPAETQARELLRASLAELAGEREVERTFIDGWQPWAVDELLDAGLDLRQGGAVAVRGEVGPMRPYLPSGSYL